MTDYNVIPGARQALVSNDGLATMPWYRWLQSLQQAANSGTASDAALAAAIRQIAIALGSPDGTVEGIPAQAAAATITGDDAITVYGALATGGVNLALTGFGDLTTDALTEGTVHLYFNKPRVAASLAPGAGIALTVDGAGNTTISADTSTGHPLTDWSGTQLTDWSGHNLVDWYVPTIAVTTVFGRTGDVVAVIDDYASVMDPTTAWAFL